MTPFEVKVSKTEVVAATLPMDEHRLPLSNLDLLMPPFLVGVFFCYKKPPSSAGHTFGSIIEVLKKALGQTLVAYYAFAGEMATNIAGEPELLCNNRGVDFVEAYADIELRELNLYNPDESIEGKLVPRKENGVLAVQATQLNCGGVVVGCKFVHRVADAYSANMFLVSWAEMAQSKPLSVLPSFQRSSLSARRPGNLDPSINNMCILNSRLPPPERESSGSMQIAPAYISRIYHVEAEQIRQLQLLANFGNDSSSKRTKFEAFSAFLWKLIATAANADDEYCRLAIVVDGRTRLTNGDGVESEAKFIMPRYFGNVLSVPFGEKKNKELEAMRLSSTANEIHKFLDGAVTTEHFRGLIDYVEAHRPEPILFKICTFTVTKEEPAVVVSSGLRFPIRKIDFGWGVPVFGSIFFPWDARPGYVMPIQSPSGNGDWVVYMYLSKEQIETIENNAAHVFKPFSADILNQTLSNLEFSV